MALTLTVAALCFFASTGAARMQTAAPASSGPGTGMIVGQVLDGSTGQPIGEAIVSLTLSGSPSPAERVMADADGRFFFTGLAAGGHYLQATKDGYIRGSYGQRRPWGASQSITLGHGERRTDIELRVWKYAVIGGTVVDEAGEPVVGIAVRALVKDVVAGRPAFGNREVIPELVPTAITDDRGMFRLSQVSPGSYAVVVPSTHATVPAAALQNPDAALRTELFWGGVLEVTPLGQPRTVQMGDFALMSVNRVLIPPPPTPEGRMQVYRTTYYPGATTAVAATPISVKSGDERTDLTITLRPVPAVRVSGRLVTPDGSPAPPITIRLVGEAMAGVISALPNGSDYVGFEAATGLSDARGRFALIGVPPGEYVLTEANRILSRFAREGRPAHWISQRLNVGDQDITDLTVNLQPALRVEGRVELRRESNQQSTAAATPPGMTFETPYGEPGQFAVEMNRETLTFSALARGGQYIVRPYELSGWFVQSVTLDGKDITDRVFDLQSDATTLVVTYTDRAFRVTGRVTDDRGDPSPTAVVLAFPTDRRRWSGQGAFPRTSRSSLTLRDGAYTFAHLPPGEYYVVAVEPADADGWQDPAKLEALAGVAARISIAAGDTIKTLDLRVRTPR